MSSGNKLFGKRIKELREKKKYTQEQLAEIVELEYQTISRIETGYYFTSYENLEKFAKAFEVELPALFDYEHLKSREELISEIDDALASSSDKELQNLYKMIIGYLK